MYRFFPISARDVDRLIREAEAINDDSIAIEMDVSLINIDDLHFDQIQPARHTRPAGIPRINIPDAVIDDPEEPRCP